MITGPQIRAARALLGWSGADLARRAGISYPTVQRAETATGVPGLRLYNLIVLKRTLEVGGVIFLAQGELRDGGPGVRLPRS